MILLDETPSLIKERWGNNARSELIETTISGRKLRLIKLNSKKESEAK